MITRMGLTAVMLTLIGTSAQAASTIYFMDQSNALDDGVNYLQVTIQDGVDGAIDFTVELLEPLTGIAGGNFGIQTFGFNGAVSADNIVGLPDSWKVQENKNGSQFGRFDVRLHGTGNSRQDPLTFSIVGIEGDTVNDYVQASSGGDSQFFTSHVAGFDGPYGTSSAHFAGSTLIPVPAAVWLFGSALALLAWVRRRLPAAA